MPHRKILVCDDDQDILEITSMLLEAEDFDVVTQLNSTALISQALKEKPDLMLIDLWMPVLPGNKLTKEIKITPEIANVPVIIFSAAVEGRELASEAGADGFIEKPFDIDKLAKLINHTLDTKQIH